MYKKTLFLGLVMLSLMACNNGDKPTDTNEDTQEAVAETYGNADFEITCQPNWIWQEVAAGTYVIHSPMKNEKDTFAEKVSLVVEDFGDLEMSLDSFAQTTAQNVEVEDEYMTEMKLLETEKIDSADIPYYKLVYTGKYEGKAFKWRQHLYLEHNKAFILTYVALPDTYEEYWADGEKTMNSLLIKEPVVEEVVEEEEIQMEE